MRDYQREYKNPYWMRKALYYEVLWIIRGYNDLKKEYNDRIDEGMSPGSETPGGKTNSTGDPTGMKAIKLTVISEQIRAIEKARLVIPFQYMEGIWNNIQDGVPYPRDADRHTYGRWKSRYIWEVAKNLNKV